MTNVKRRSGGGWVAAANVYRRQGGAWVKVWPTSLAVSGPNSVFGSATGSPPTGTVTSPNVVLVPQNGSGSYTVSWTKLSGPLGVTATAPSSFTTAFSQNNLSDVSVSIWRATVSDGLTTVTHDVEVTLLYTQV